MQYSIQINQVKAVEWKLTPAQAALLSFLWELEAWGEDVVQNEQAYKWISKEKVLKELPLYFSKPDTVHRNLIELQKKGLIVRNSTSRKSLVKLTSKGREWRLTSASSEVGFKSDHEPDEVGFKSYLGRNEIPPRSDRDPTDHINQDTNNQDSKKPSSEKKFSDDDYRCAEWISEKVLEVNQRAKPNLDKWADMIRLMRERDNLTHREIATVFSFANKDSFWRTNILSPTKLREKFGQLEAKMNQGLTHDQSTCGQGSEPFGDQSQYPEDIRFCTSDSKAIRQWKLAEQQHIRSSGSQVLENGNGDLPK